MTTQEITKLLEIPNSTLSDWDNSSKRKNLVKLLRALKSEDVIKIINAKDQKPKYSFSTRKIRLNKKLFKKDMLWSRQDGSQIEIKNLISVYLNTPNQEDTETLLKMFGYERVISELYNNASIMPKEDYTEALEQIKYADEPDSYFDSYPLPALKQIFKKPKKRYIDALIKQYAPLELINMAKEFGVTYPSMFQIKKMTGLNV